MLTIAELKAMPSSDYMCEAQLEFFRTLLIEQKKEIAERIEECKQVISSQERECDDLDKAMGEEEMRLRLRIADRESKLLRKIDQSLSRIREGDYGYCNVSGEPIGIERLLIRPTATMCAEEKRRSEMIERHFAEDRE